MYKLFLTVKSIKGKLNEIIVIQMEIRLRNLNPLMILKVCFRLVNIKLNLLKGTLLYRIKKNSLRKKSSAIKNTLIRKRIITRKNKVTGLIKNRGRFDSET